MGIADEMRRLTQDIASSCQDRAERLGEIKEEVSDLIKGFQTSRKEVKAELKEFSDAWQGLTAVKAKNKVRRTKKWESQQE